MSNDWQIATLGELCSMRYGKLLPKTSLSDVGYPVWSGYSVVGYHDQFMFEEPEVSITCRGVGGTGDIHMTPPKSWVTNLAIVIRPFSTAGIRKDFLYWAMQATDRQHLITGSAQSQITIDHLQHHQIRFPAEDEQRVIAGILGALDEKIEQSRRTAQALERLARVIYCAWFVDFEPVKAKAAGATHFPSMPQPVFDALPALFTDSDIGPVPEGWGVKPLANVAAFLNGLALQKYPPRGDGSDLPVIKIAQLRKGSTDGADLANGDVPGQYVVGDRDLLFSWSGTLEATLWFGGKGALNQHLFKVTSDDYPSWLCLLWIQQHLPWFRAIAAGKATTMGHIKRGHLTETKVVIATPQVLQAAGETIGPLYELYAQTMLESRNLAEMRDYLLPKLLSGEIRVGDAARAAAAMA